MGKEGSEGRWEPYILGLLTASLIGDEHIGSARRAIGLTFVGAWPEMPIPQLIVAVSREDYSDRPLDPRHYRITVEEIP